MRPLHLACPRDTPLVPARIVRSLATTSGLARKNRQNRPIGRARPTFPPAIFAPVPSGFPPATPVRRPSERFALRVLAGPPFAGPIKRNTGSQWLSVRTQNHPIPTLERLTPRLRAVAALAALRVADDPESPTLARVWASSVSPAAARRDASRLARHWARIDQAARRAALDAFGDNLSAVVGDLSAAPDPELRAAAARITAAAAERAGLSSDLTARLRALVADVEPSVRTVAVASACASLEPALARSERIDESLDALLAEICRAYPEHRDKRPMDALASSPIQPGPALDRWLRDEEQAGLLALRAALRRSVGRHARLQALRLLAYPAVAAAALGRLGAPATIEEHEQTLVAWPALLHAERTRALRRASGAQALLPPESECSSLSAAAQLGLLQWSERSPVGSARRDAARAGRLACQDPMVRAVAARLLVADGDRAAAAGLLRDFAFDADPRVARLAAAGLLSRPLPIAGQAVAALLRSPHASVRAAARAAARRADMWATPIAARAALLREPQAFIQDMRSRIVAGDPQQRIGAMLLAKRLGVVGHVELETLAAATDRDPRVVAAAAVALGAVDRTSSIDALSRLTAHPDPRVRSNAVESLGALRPAASVIEAKLNDPHPRLRAAAIVASMGSTSRRQDAIRSLTDMLRDERPTQRISALWAAERAAATEVASVVAHVAAGAESDAEREWSRRCARRLLTQLRARERAAQPSAVRTIAAAAPAPPAEGVAA